MTLELSCVAVSVNVPEILSLFAAVTLSTVALAEVSVRLFAVMFPSSVPLKVMSLPVASPSPRVVGVIVTSPNVSTLVWAVMATFPDPLLTAPAKFRSLDARVMSPPEEESAPIEIVSPAVKAIAPPAVCMASLVSENVISPAEAVKVTEFPEPCARLRVPSLRFSMVMESVAVKMIFVVLESPSRVPSKIVALLTVSPKPFVTAPEAVEPEPSLIVTVSGSSNRVPVFPLEAERSAVPLKKSSSLPETSAKPPSPNSLPPRAFNRPRNWVRRSAQKMMRPPFPCVSASA